jgi:hypothetical protein
MYSICIIYHLHHTTHHLPLTIHLTTTDCCPRDCTFKNTIAALITSHLHLYYYYYTHTQVLIIVLARSWQFLMLLLEERQ